MRATTSAAAVLLFGLAAAVPAHARQSAIARENAKKGTTDWDVRPADHPAIEGWSTEPSARPGKAFHLHVRARRGDRYRIAIYRLGWYGGAGGRLVRCVPDCGTDEPAVAQPPAPAPERRTGRVVTHWKVTDVVPVRRSWMSGYYVAQLRVTSGPDAGAIGRVPLVVRGRPGNHAAVLVQVPVNTWQAYNGWGGKSLYPFNSTHGVSAVKVSFDRPYSEAEPVEVPYTLELPAARFLEREGYDMTYVTDVDVDRTPALLLRHRLAVSIGHDEYWSHTMRDAWDMALARSTNVAALGANTAYWQARYENGHHTLVEYRYARADPVKNPALRTIQFRKLHPRRPECELFAVMYDLYAQRSSLGPPTRYEVVAPRGFGWMHGTGLEHGDRLPSLVGYEWDTLVPHCFVGRVTRVLHAAPVGVDHHRHRADAVRAVAHSGARVFASGSLELGWGIDGYGHDTQLPLERMMRNVLRDLTRPAPPRPIRLATVGRGVLKLRAPRRAPDPRLRRTLFYRHAGTRRFALREAVLVCSSLSGTWHDRAPHGASRYAAVNRDRWGRSTAVYSRTVRR